MRLRPSPLPTPPDKPVWFALDLPGRGVHDLRLPWPVYTAAVFRLLQEAGITELMDPAVAARRPGAQAAVWRACGVAIGTAWQHREQALDADVDAFGDDLAAYGAAVMDELHEEGYSGTEIAALHGAVIRRMSESLHSSEEVAKRAAFFGPAPGTASSSPSTSVSTSSAETQ